MAQTPFFWGRAGAKLTPDQVARERETAALLAKGAMDFSPVQHWTQGLGRVAQGLLAGIDYRMADRAEADIADRNKTLIASLLSGGSASGTAPASSSIPMTSAAGEVTATAPGSAQPIDMTGNQVFSEFIGAAREGGLTNPFGLAALAATGKAESGFDPGNVGRTWNDPSESGRPGTAGGILSWRGPRYQALAATGDLSPRGQGNFFIQENPQLIAALNNAKSIEEAQSLINNAWQFAGFDRPGGESARRLQLARGFLPSFQDGGQVAAVTPQTATDAIEAVSPLQPTPEATMSFAGQERAPPVSLTDEVLAYQQTPEYAARFPGRNTLRPFQPGETRPNPDGSYSTEITTTWQLPDGSWVNVPSLWMGPNGPQEFSVDDEDSILGAMQQFEAQNGPTFQRFGSEQEAVSAAEARSSEGGAGAGPQLMTDFSGSNQLSNAQGGIIPALTGGIPASPEQIARAQAAAQAPIEVAGGGDRVPMAATGTSGINPAIIEALTDPQASPQTQRIAGILLEQQQRQAQAAEERRLQAADPMRRIELESAQIKLDQMRNPTPGFRTLSTEEKTALGLPPQGSFQMSREGQISQIGGGGVNITNEGTIPAGYQAVRDEQGRVTSIQPLPGSPAALEMEQALRSRETQGGRKETATDIITNAASSARNLIKTGTLATGTLGRLAANFSESDAAELRRQIDVLKSNATIENLTAMRQASPTGGALGSVTEKEGAMLAAAAGAIDPDAGAKQVEKGLDNYERNLLRIIHGPKVGDAIFEQTRQEKPITEMTDEELEALANGD